MTSNPLYPFESNFITFSHGQLHYHYIDEGNSEKGCAVVMLHGNPTWSFFYRNLILTLRGRHRCVVPDHMGCGLSDKPQDYPYTLAQHISNTESLLDRLELKEVVLIVHDWGGAIGMGVAVRNPKRIKKLVIMNSAAFPSPRIPLRINICRIPILGDIAIRGLNAFSRAALFMAVAHRERITPEIAAGFLAPYDSYANRIALLRFVQDIPMTPMHPTWPLIKNIEEGLQELKNKPMLICWGMKDWCFNESFLKTWESKFPQAEVFRIEDAAHYLLEDAHDRIAIRIQQFLSV